ncbi:CapA family protein [Kaistella sp. 97-N-M2]|uniref:CapA family protein n=1 Tax=Kaistella sp. 97-N-M2 TaxID=2908645 RepID=UPI001F459C84|nr:CapA family protein [Kaistella sp. 97-N-M2]UJF29141.1 CapA family protein [Kaistella sp. 97-N-M2]
MGLENQFSIVISGDLCPTKDTEHHFISGDHEQIFGDCLPFFENADFLVGNLEFVLTDDPKPIKKSGPILYGDTAFVNIFKKAGFDLLSLANNHIKDCGEEGVQSTLKAVAKIGINTFGAARNLIEAKKPFIKEIKGKKIAFLTFAEQEFNTASENEYGANFFDPYEDLDLIAEIKKRVDHLIILYHGGIEYYEYPSPLLQKKCRRFIDKGADLVTCQHSHCIGTIERYQDKTIVYGQGNTLFGYREGNDSWNQGLLLDVQFNENDFKINYKGVQAIKEGGIRLLTEKENQKLLKKIEERSKLVNDSVFIRESWQKFCRKKESLYLPQYLALNRYFIHLNRWTNNKFISVFFLKKYLRSSHNIMRCEAHNEVIQTILKRNSKE